MTFEKWYQKNSKEIYLDKKSRHGGLASPTKIRMEFENCWHNGFKAGFSSPSKTVKPKPIADLSHGMEFDDEWDANEN